jgi:hypothetical protein
MQMLYQLSQASSPFSSGYFRDETSRTAELASNLYPPNFSLPNRITGMSSLHLSVTHVFEVKKSESERLSSFLKAHSHTVVKQ